MKLRAYLLQGIPLQYSTSLPLQQWGYISTIVSLMRKCFKNAVPKRGQIKIWGIHEVNDAPLPGDTIIFANYSSDTERFNYKYWKIRFMGVVRYTAICPTLSELLFGSDYWKTMLLLSEVYYDSYPHVKNAILDFLKIYIKPEGYKRWRLSEPVGFKDFIRFLEEHVNKRNKNELRNFILNIQKIISKNIEFREDSEIRLLLWSSL
ncbi:hypothetical protein PNA2_0994 [Pyrococcus sp. NA2]|nr:hypothetical protein PNA2_0994 [Pyrococcus sp. NA2]